CNSKPLSPGICTSTIRHDVWRTLPDSRNSSADANVSALCPRRQTNPSITSRIDASSSTIDIIGTCPNQPILVPRVQRVGEDSADTTQWSSKPVNATILPARKTLGV